MSARLDDMMIEMSRNEESMQEHPDRMTDAEEIAALLPCPFCGGESERIDLPADDPTEPNAGGSFIHCPACLASSKLVFGEKVGLEEAWNARARRPEPCQTDRRCTCTMAHSLTGDGCRYCQPQEYIDRLHNQIEEDRKEREADTRQTVGEVEALRAEIEEWRRLVADGMPLVDGEDWINRCRALLARKGE